MDYDSVADELYPLLKCVTNGEELSDILHTADVRRLQLLKNLLFYFDYDLEYYFQKVPSESVLKELFSMYTGMGFISNSEEVFINGNMVEVEQCIIWRRIIDHLKNVTEYPDTDFDECAKVAQNLIENPVLQECKNSEITLCDSSHQYSNTDVQELLKELNKIIELAKNTDNELSSHDYNGDLEASSHAPLRKFDNHKFEVVLTEWISKLESKQKHHLDITQCQHSIHSSGYGSASLNSTFRESECANDSFNKIFCEKVISLHHSCQSISQVISGLRKIKEECSRLLEDEGLDHIPPKCSRFSVKELGTELK